MKIAPSHFYLHWWLLAMEKKLFGEYFTSSLSVNTRLIIIENFHLIVSSQRRHNKIN